MIHPDTEIRRVNPLIGNGVFATKKIPRGTIVVAKDRFDLSLTRQEFSAFPEPLKSTMETFLYHDKQGHLILSWDHARYMNHNCNSNTMMTDYNLEIAVRDISPGEEITSEYGLLNIQEPYELHCGGPHCRRHLELDDIDRYGDLWDAQIKASLLAVFETPQPLIKVMSEQDRDQLKSLQQNPGSYRSVKTLKWHL